MKIALQNSLVETTKVGIENIPAMVEFHPTEEEFHEPVLYIQKLVE